MRKEILYTTFNQLQGGIAMAKRIYVFAVTGGPCAGKTSLLDKFQREASMIPKLKVIFAKEASTLLQQSGINFMAAGGGSAFQEMIIEQQLTAEANAYRTAKLYTETNDEDTVIIVCDRGIMDGEAYFDSPEEFERVLTKYALNREKVYARYDAIVCLRSAAVGAKEFYTTHDGTPRSENVDEAAELDEKVVEAWNKHADFTEITNEFKFQIKLDRAIATILTKAGIEIPREVCKRYVVKMPGIFEIMKLNNPNLFTDQTFFLDSKNPNSFSAVKIRRVGENATYYSSKQKWEIINHPDNGKEVEAATYDATFAITEKEFLHSLKSIDSSIRALVKSTYSFYIGTSIRCEIDIYHCNQHRAYLRAYLDADTDENRQLVARNFKVIREVTYEKRYSEHEIANSNGEVLNN